MIQTWINRLARRANTRGYASAAGDIAPQCRFYAIGDVHGRLDLLQRLLAGLDPETPLVFVGDYVDRGDYSAHVLRHLHHLCEADGRKVICLLGNHEEMLLNFIDAPKRTCRLWLRNGGLQTLNSFGLTDIAPDMAGDVAEGAAERLRIAMGEPLLEWLRALPLVWTSGNVTAVHAALDPKLHIQQQRRDVCLWGHPRFPEGERSDNQWVVHGHTIVPEPKIQRRVISIDTGAFATGRLTAADIRPGEVQFWSTGESAPAATR
ncbi:MAG: metallophosphoesterase family protein [Ruegeria sp.]